MFGSFAAISLKMNAQLIVPALIWRPIRQFFHLKKIPLQLQHITVMVPMLSSSSHFSHEPGESDAPQVSYPPRHRWRSSVRPDSSPSPWGRSVWSPPARSARDGPSPGGRSGGSGFDAWGTGSCPQKRCSSASWKKDAVLSVWDGFLLFCKACNVEMYWILDPIISVLYIWFKLLCVFLCITIMTIIATFPVQEPGTFGGTQSVSTSRFRV